MLVTRKLAGLIRGAVAVTTFADPLVKAVIDAQKTFALGLNESIDSKNSDRVLIFILMWNTILTRFPPEVARRIEGNLNIRQEVFSGAMMRAAWRGLVDVIPAFIEAGAQFKHGAGYLITLEDPPRASSAFPNIPLVIERLPASTIIALLEVFLQHGWQINDFVMPKFQTLHLLLFQERRTSIVHWFIRHVANLEMPCLISGSNCEVCQHLPMELLKPLDIAAISSCRTREDVELLVKCGAKLDLSNALHHAALRLTSQAEGARIISYILKEGIDIDFFSQSYQVPEELESLVEVWTSLKLVGLTALQWAVLHGTIGMAKFLLSRGASRERKSIEGLTALDYAKKENKRGMIDVLENYDPMRRLEVLVTVENGEVDAENEASN